MPYPILLTLLAAVLLTVQPALANEDADTSTEQVQEQVSPPAEEEDFSSKPEDSEEPAYYEAFGEDEPVSETPEVVPEPEPAP